MNVHEASVNLDETIQAIRNDLVILDGHKNEDIGITLQGYLHNRTGFVLNVHNIENVTDHVLESWKHAIAERGFSCEISNDFQEARVRLKCIQRAPKKKCSCPFGALKNLVYLSILLVSLYKLCSRLRE